MTTETRPLRIVLLSPKGPLYRHKTGIFRKDLRAGPLTLTTLSSLIPKEINASVRIVDEGVEAIPDQIDADLVGITLITGSAPRAYEIAARLRAQKIPVVLGGPHVSLVPDEAQRHGDAIVVGYAEETWPQLLRDFITGTMQPRYNMAREFSFAKLPEIPFAHRHLLKRGAYRTTSTFEATRGCIHRCEFCVVPNAWGTRPFQKPISHIIADIKQWGAKKILFYDLNLFADFSYARELFDALTPLRIQWFGLSTTLIGKDPALMQLAARSGCRGLLIGFESVSKKALAAYNKGFNNPEEYPKLIEDLHALKILVNGTFVFGNDADELSTFDEVRDFVLRSRMDLPRFAIMTPFPGTPLFYRLQAAGRILHMDWSKYDGQHVVFQPTNMTPDELQRGHEKVWKETYSWGGLARRARLHFEHAPLWFGANIAYRFYARNLHRFYTCTGGMT